MNCNPPGSSVHGDSPGKNTGAGCHALLQQIFPTQGSNPRLSNCRQTLSHLSHQGSLSAQKTVAQKALLLLHLVPNIPRVIPTSRVSDALGGLVAVVLLINFILQSSFRLTAKSSRKYRPFSYTPSPPHTQLPHHQHPPQCGALVTTGILFSADIYSVNPMIQAFDISGIPQTQGPNQSIFCYFQAIV